MIDPSVITAESEDTFLAFAVDGSSTNDVATPPTSGTTNSATSLANLCIRHSTTAHRRLLPPTTLTGTPVLPCALPALCVTAASRFQCSQPAPRKLNAAVFEGKTASIGSATIAPELPSNKLSVSVERVQVDALVDTGASISVILADLCSRLVNVKTPHTDPYLRGAKGNDI